MVHWKFENKLSKNWLHPIIYFSEHAALPRNDHLWRLIASNSWYLGTASNYTQTYYLKTDMHTYYLKTSPPTKMQVEKPTSFYVLVCDTHYTWQKTKIEIFASFWPLLLILMTDIIKTYKKIFRKIANWIF